MYTLQYDIDNNCLVRLFKKLFIVATVSYILGHPVYGEVGTKFTVSLAFYDAVE